MEDRALLSRLAVAFIVVILAPPAGAQVLPPLGDLPLDPQILQQVQRQATQQAVPAVLALEGALDPEAYVVGPGDQFTVAIGGSFSQEFRSIVSADGHLLIPEVGRFAVAGLTLAEVDAAVRPSLRRVYRNVPAELALTQPRRFYVHVSGAVSKPGRHLMGPIARAEDAVRAAMDDQNPLAVIRQIERLTAITGEQRMLPALRNVRIMHTDGSATSIDLRHYYATGAAEHNPYLRDGDVIVVPPFEAYTNAVFVDGPVLAPGAFDHRKGDTVASLLTVAAGTDMLETIGHVRLVGNDGSSRTVSLNPHGTEVLVQPGDRLVVQPAHPELGSVRVEGRVMFPGEYPIRIGITTVDQLVDMAGGLRPDALPHAAFVERRGTTRPHLTGHEGEVRRTAGDPDRAPTQAELELRFQDEAARLLRLVDLDYASRQYLLSELRRTPRIPVDVSDARAGELVLRDGDRLVVPEDAGGIYVFGQVAHTGVVPFEANLTAADYVRRAGGVTSAATGVYVRRAGSEMLLESSQVAYVRPGDAVFVDRRPVADLARDEQLRVQEQMLRAQHRQQWIQAGSAILATATAIITAFIFTR